MNLLSLRFRMRTVSLIALIFTAAALSADTFHLTNPAAPGVTTNPGQTLQTASTGASGWTPITIITGTPAYFYNLPFSGAFAAGTWQLIIWTNAPGCTSNVSAEIGYANSDGSGFVSLGNQTIDINLSGAGNHPTTYNFGSLPFTTLVSKVLRVRLQLSGGCPVTMAYNAGVDFDSRLITPFLGSAGTPTVTPTQTRSPTPTATLAPALSKSVNTATAILNQTITYSINYTNPNATAPSGCQDTFENGSTGWSGGWSPPTGGTWGLVADNGPTMGGSQALDANAYGGYNFTDILCAPQVTDGYIQSDVKVMTAGGEITLLWRRNGSSTYQFHIKQGTAGNVSLRVITLAAFNEIAVTNYTINQDQWYKLRFEVIGFTLNAYINGALVLTATDPNLTYNSGAASLEVDDAPGTGIHARFDNVIISNYAKEWWKVTLVDTLPAGLTYISSGCGGSRSGQVVTIDLGDLPAGASGSCQIVAVTNICPATLVNRAEIQVGLPATIVQSNNATTNVSCSSPTPTWTRTDTRTSTPTYTSTLTDTRTNSPTPTATQTATSSNTLTATHTNTLTATSSSTSTYTATLTSAQSSTHTMTSTPSFTPTSTLTHTPTLTSTQSATRSSTPTASSTLTSTSTRTATLTASPSSTLTATPTETLTRTPSSTATVTSTASNTRTVTETPSDTPPSTATSTPTVTSTPSYTSTPSVTKTPTSSATITVTFTSTLTRSPTSTSTVTLTATRTITNQFTPTDSVTITVTSSLTATLTASPSLTATPSYSRTLTSSPSSTITPTSTATPTPLFLPFHIEVSAYNEAGERVKTLYSGSSEHSATDVTLSGESLAAGNGMLALNFGGRLADGSTQLLWAGDNDQMQFLSTGVYYLHLETKDTFGTVTAMIKAVTVLAPPTRSSISVFNSAGELVAKLTAPAGLGTLAWASLEDNTMVAGLKSLNLGLRGGSGTGSILWDGRKADGSLVSAGSYTVLVHDQNYNAELSFTVLKAPDADMAQPIAAPNPAHASDQKLSIVVGKSSARRQVCLYNAAGELITRAEAGAQDEKVEFGIGGLAGGIYIGTVQDELTKKIRTLKICVMK